MTTAATAPSHAATTPDSNSPSSFDVPTNSVLTALTPGQRVHLPADRDAQHLARGHREHACVPEQHERALREPRIVTRQASPFGMLAISRKSRASFRARAPD